MEKRPVFKKSLRMIFIGMVLLLFSSGIGEGNEALAEGHTITLSTEELTLFVGDSYHLSAFFTPVVSGKTKIHFYAYNKKKNKKGKKNKYISVDKKTGQIKALAKGKTWVCVSGKMWNKKTECYDEISDLCEITILGSSNFSLNKSRAITAVGSSGETLKVNDAKEADSISWSSSDETVVKVDGKGKTTPVGAGTAVISAGIKTADTMVYYECSYVVTNPVLNKNEVALEAGNMTELAVSGIAEGSTISFASTDEKVATVDSRGCITAVSAGTAAVQVMADGAQLSCAVTVTRPQVASKVLILQVGGAKTLIPSIDTAVSSVHYVSDNEAVASVDRKGKVRAVSQGNAMITLTAGEKKEEFHVSVLENSIGMSVVNEGLEKIAAGSRYSTSRRMEEGYYDCSSFVFRLYAPHGVTFGMSADANAPTAANLAKWLSANGEVLEYGPVYDLDRLLPGDLIFYNYNGENSRYLNVDHVSIYAGYGRIIHASDEQTGVKEANYWIDNYIVMVARPVSTQTENTVIDP